MLALTITLAPTAFLPALNNQIHPDRPAKGKRDPVRCRTFGGIRGPETGLYTTRETRLTNNVIDEAARLRPQHPVSPQPLLGDVAAQSHVARAEE